MAIHFGTEPFATNQVIDLVTQERSKALSVREWKHRLAGYGYSVENREDGAVVTSLAKGVEICVLPDGLMPAA